MGKGGGEREETYCGIWGQHSHELANYYSCHLKSDVVFENICVVVENNNDGEEEVD